jgi:arylsulfatase
MGFLCDMPLSRPGYTSQLPRSAAPIPRVLRDAGYSTLAVGKWHLTPRGHRSVAGPFDSWPLGFGFERYYGFLQGDTNQWVPNLVADNHYVSPPATPDEGYHLTEDLADQAIERVIAQQQAAPGKPFFLYFATGAMHAPHHVAPEWIEPYRGAYDDGWDRWRERTFARQLELGVVPEGTTLTPRPSWVPAWDDLDADARRLFARMQETYAGFLMHTDAQIGRLLDALASSGILDDTIVVAFSDNGASAEGGQLGTYNEHRFSGGLAESVAGNLEHVDDWGGVRGYPHYAWGWAWAGNTPFRLWKRYTWLGGTRTPLIVHWPAGTADRGAVRSTMAHVVDVAPTLLDACGVDWPAAVDGVVQQRVDGRSLMPSFADGAIDPPRTQYFEMLGSRALIDGRWKATTDHVSTGVIDEERLLEGSRDFATDQWALFDLDADFSEADDVSGEHPDVVARLEQTWMMEAGRNQVFPLADGLVARLDAMLPMPHPPPNPATFVPAGGPVNDESVPFLAGGGTIVAEVTVDGQGPDAPAPEGVLCALGDWNAGYALWVHGSVARFDLNVGGVGVRVEAAERLGSGDQTVVATLRRAGDGSVIGVGVPGHLTEVEVDVVLPFAWQHGGTQLRLGHDEGLPVTPDYDVPARWTGALHRVTIHAGKPDADHLGELLRTSLHSD